MSGHRAAEPPRPDDVLGERVDLLLTSGEVWGAGIARGYYTQPTYVVDVDFGPRAGSLCCGWSADLVRLSGDERPGTPAPRRPADLAAVLRHLVSELEAEQQNERDANGSPHYITGIGSAISRINHALRQHLAVDNHPQEDPA